MKTKKNDELNAAAFRSILRIWMATITALSAGEPCKMWYFFFFGCVCMNGNGFITWNMPYMFINYKWRQSWQEEEKMCVCGTMRCRYAILYAATYLLCCVYIFLFLFASLNYWFDLRFCDTHWGGQQFLWVFLAVFKVYHCIHWQLHKKQQHQQKMNRLYFRSSIEMHASCSLDVRIYQFNLS